MIITIMMIIIIVIITQPPRTKCSHSSIVLVFNLVFSPRDLYYRRQKRIIIIPG